MIKKNKLTRFFRIGLPLLIITLWLVGAGFGGPYFGKIEQVSSNDLSTFLPDNAESTHVRKQFEEFQNSSTIPAIVVFESKNELSEEDRSDVDRAKEALQATGVVDGEIGAPRFSENKKAAILVVPLSSDADMKKDVPRLQEALAAIKPSLDYKFTGPAMFSRDLNKAFAGIDGTLLIVALAVVFIILLIVYRSPILPFITLIGAMAALATAILVVWHLANAGYVQLNGQVQGILFILVIGAATDYSLLYIARYREELTEYTSVIVATKAAWKASFEPILAAGGTVSLGLLCLLASDLGSNKALGPVGSIGIVFSVLVALTFLPAALLIFGRTAFWPRKPKYISKKNTIHYKANHPTWYKVGQLVRRHPRRLWIGTLVLLVLACFAVPQLKAEGVSQENLILGESEARDGQAMVNRHFAQGAGSPAIVLVPENQVDAMLKVLESNTGVDSVSITTSDKGKPVKPLGRYASEINNNIREEIEKERAKKLDDIRTKINDQMVGMPQFAIDAAYEQAISSVPSVDELAEKANPFKDIQAKVVDGKVALQATLTHVPSSLEARQTITALREDSKRHGIDASFGGVSAVQQDTNAASKHDLMIIIPLILGAITIVLMLLLRSIVAPLVLLATTVLSFGATLGISALLFNHIWHFAGADPAVIIYGFVFLVALGIDYNIFLMTRVREETGGLGVQNGTIKALVVTGGVITSAGIVLAATFAALNVIPILFLAQISFIVAFGVLLDTLVVRSLLVPALTLEIGKPMWWPSKLWRQKK